MDHLAYFRDVYDGFNRRDVKRVLAMMTEDVLWPNAWKGGRLVGRDAVRAYWAEQWAEINPEVTPLSVSERGDGTLAVKVRQVVRSLDGETLSDDEVVHVYQMRNGLIARMDVEQPTA
jgi:ketosteroid isomerase-like protein